MIRTSIDWKKCNEDLTDKFPQIEAELKEGMDKVCRENFRYKIHLMNYPPRVEVVFPSQAPCDEKALKKARPMLAEVVAEVAVKYNLKAESGIYTGIDKAEYDEKTYTLKPDFGQYKKKRIKSQ